MTTFPQPNNCKYQNDNNVPEKKPLVQLRIDISVYKSFAFYIVFLRHQHSFIKKRSEKEFHTYTYSNALIAIKHSYKPLVSLFTLFLHCHYYTSSKTSPQEIVTSRGVPDHIAADRKNPLRLDELRNTIETRSHIIWPTNSQAASLNTLLTNSSRLFVVNIFEGVYRISPLRSCWHRRKIFRQKKGERFRFFSFYFLTAHRLPVTSGTQYERRKKKKKKRIKAHKMRNNILFQLCLTF